MRKLLIFMFGLLFSTQSFATGIDSGATNADCDSDTLGQTSGTVNMEMDWQPNTIQIRWYNGNTLINTTNGAENSCVYDDDLYLPATPTRKGYTFEGWELRPEMDFSTIPDTTGQQRWSKGIDLNTNEIRCHYNGHYNDCHTSGFLDLETYEWKTSFNHGVLYGTSKCSAKSGTVNIATNWSNEDLDSAVGDKKYCWCRATGYKPNNSNIIYASSSVLSWVHRDYSSCSTGCSNACAVDAYYTSFRTALFTPASN